MSESLMIQKRGRVCDGQSPVKKCSEVVCNGRFFVTGNRGKLFLDNFRPQKSLQNSLWSISDGRKVSKILREGFPAAGKRLKFYWDDFRWQNGPKNYFWMISGGRTVSKILFGRFSAPGKSPKF